VEFSLVRAGRRRHVQLSVDPWEGIEVRGSPLLTVEAAREALESHACWLHRELGRLEGNGPWTILPGARLPFLGGQLELAAGPAKGLGVSENEPVLVLPTGVLEPGRGEDARAYVERWYRVQARSYFAARVKALAPRFGHRTPSAISVRAQRTRWGSCSRAGRISLNWRLMMLPAVLVDYVIAHELCHLSYMNHGEEFWDLLAGGVPDHASLRAELRRAWPPG